MTLRSQPPKDDDDDLDALAYDIVLAASGVSPQEHTNATCNLRQLRVRIFQALLTERRASRLAALKNAATIALNPYSNAVEAYAGDEPKAVGRKIAAAIEAMEP